MRLFVAILLDEPVRAALSVVQKKLAPRCRSVKWVAPEQLHLTVKFLGDVPDQQVKEVSDAIMRAAAGGSPFTIRVAGCGCFPARGAPRTVWAAGSESSGAMLSCVQRIHAALEGLGFPPEDRAWSPHITIGRVKEPGDGEQIRLAAQTCQFEELAQPVLSVGLMSSVLSPKGPTYAVVSTARFG